MGIRAISVNKSWLIQNAEPVNHVLCRPVRERTFLLDKLVVVEIVSLYSHYIRIRRPLCCTKRGNKGKESESIYHSK